MPRYFLNQRHRDDLIEDVEGAEFASLDAVRKEIILAAREIMTDRLRAGKELDHSAFEVTDERGRIVLRMSFSEALPRADGDAT